MLRGVKIFRRVPLKCSRCELAHPLRDHHFALVLRIHVIDVLWRLRRLLMRTAAHVGGRGHRRAARPHSRVIFAAVLRFRKS